ncbi:hypothetical protein IWW45_009536 [Coemansia sp. RSA 485]|nr:hypothetical protein IWW45_009536 [Coemansia sp. RSA 485]
MTASPDNRALEKRVESAADPASCAKSETLFRAELAQPAKRQKVQTSDEGAGNSAAALSSSNDMAAAAAAAAAAAVSSTDISAFFAFGEASGPSQGSSQPPRPLE